MKRLYSYVAHLKFIQASVRAELIQFYSDINKTTSDACLAGEWLCSRNIHYRKHNTHESNGTQFGFMHHIYYLKIMHGIYLYQPNDTIRKDVLAA